MVHHPPAPAVEAPPQQQPQPEPEPAFDAEMVRDFFNYLLVGLEGDEPENGFVTSFKETAALGLKCWSMSGVMVIMTAVTPLTDSIRMAKFLLKKTFRADWDVLNLDPLLAAADLAIALLKTGNALKKLTTLLKSAKGMGPVVKDADDHHQLLEKLAMACSKIDDATLEAMKEAAFAFEMPDMQRDSMAAVDVINDATATVRKALVACDSGAGLEAKRLHKLVKKAYRDLMLLLKATTFDLPYINPFHV